MITKGSFGSYGLYVLSNSFLEVAVTGLGATVLSVKYKGEEMTCGYQCPKCALEGKGFLFKSVGRYANRIGNACFDLDGKHYVLAPNEGKNQLHGGPDSYDKRIWNTEIVDGVDERGEKTEALKCSIFSPDGDNGFPGNLTMTVTFSLVRSTLHIVFGGETDAPTHFAPTVHPYFNLGRSGSVMDARLQIKASGHLDVDSELIPTGKILPCDGRFDFSQTRTISTDFDDCFICPEEYCCTLEMNGHSMEVWTDMPAIQIYTGISMPAPYNSHDGVAIEPEFYPGSPNYPEFPSTVLRPGEAFCKYVDYKFF